MANRRTRKERRKKRKERTTMTRGMTTRRTTRMTTRTTRTTRSDVYVCKQHAQHVHDPPPHLHTQADNRKCSRLIYGCVLYCPSGR